MQKIKLILSILSRLFLIFLLVFIWVRFFIKKLSLAILISVSITILVDLIIKIFIKKKSKRESLKLKEQENCENMFFSLATSENYLDFYMKLAKSRHKAIKKGKYIIIEHNDGNVILYPRLSFTQLNPEDIKEIVLKLKNVSYRKIVIPCGEISKECYSFISKFEKEILLLDKSETYSKLYKEYNIFPEITVKKKESKKTTFKEILNFSFNKNKVKSYFLSTLALLFSSIFVKNNLYYCIIASILMIFAIISMFNPFEKKLNIIKTLD